MVIVNGCEYVYHECECENDYGYDYCVSVNMVIMSESILIVSMVIVSMNIGWLLCECGY